jgi:ribonuclease HII
MRKTKRLELFYPTKIIAGFDESGRGAIAGPIVVSMVILPLDTKAVFKDSKLMTATQRKLAYQLILKIALDLVIVIKNNRIVDQLNPKQTTVSAFTEALMNAQIIPDLCIVDYETPVFVNYSNEVISIVNGEKYSNNVAAASIVAKVTRDNIMDLCHYQFIKYHFNKNRGYLTKDHAEQLTRHGPCLIHRYSYKPIRKIIQNFLQK